MRLLKWLYEFFKENQADIEKQSSVFRWLTGLARLCKRLAINHFTLLVTVILLSVAVYIATNPSILMDDKCYVVIPGYDELILTDTERPCQKGLPIALLWDGLQQGGDQRGSFLVNDAALEPSGDRSLWYESYFPVKEPLGGFNFERHHSFETAKPREYSLFVKGTCVQGTAENTNVERRIGLTLQTGEPRTLAIDLGADLSEERWRECNSVNPREVSDAKYSDCQFGRYLLFVPTIHPVAVCSHPSILDQWLGRWAKKVEPDTKICITGVRLDGSAIPDTTWGDFARLRAVWCD